MRSDLERRIRDRRTEDGYLFPDYEGYCFARIPDAVAAVLGADDVAERPLPTDVLSAVDDAYDRVLLIVVDGFGLAYWKRHEQPLLERLETAGTVSPLTATYPSETAAALTTLHTGRVPAEHGVLGWDVYDPIHDASYEAFTGDIKAGDESADPDPQEVFEGDSIYTALSASGIECRHVVPFEDTYDGAVAHTYDWNRSEVATEGAFSLEIEGFADALESALAASEAPAYCYAYLPQIDAVAHAAGTDSDVYRDTVRATFDTLERALSGLPSDDRTLLVVTADHGHVDTDPATNVDLERFDGIVNALERHASGEPVRYAGSPRNLHLHLREPDRDRERVRARLTATLDARIFTHETALEQDLFGDRPGSETFRRRLGDLVVCHRDRSVWFGSDPDHLEMIGVHGGLHPNEMLVPFAACDLERLG